MRDLGREGGRLTAEIVPGEWGDLMLDLSL